MEKKRMLLIVDPQIDFIAGSLPVPGASVAMDRLSLYLNESGPDYESICVTCDRHGIGHCSFKENGGPWPRHCVESSVGAAVWPGLMEALYRHGDRLKFLYKGETDGSEEYSILRSPMGREWIDQKVKEGVDEIDICGLAGDVCVSQTLEDALERYPGCRLRILEEFTASLDGGAKVKEWQKSNGTE